MKFILYIILFFKPFSADCQLPNNYYKRKIMEQYQENHASDCNCIRQLYTPIDPIFEKMQEVFNNYFDPIKVYLVIFRNEHIGLHDREFYPALYAFDTSDGKIISYRNQKEFCNFVNTAHRHLSNLDKAYLYICLCLRVFEIFQFDIQGPDSYSRELCKESIFASDDNIKLLFYYPGHDSYRPNRNPKIRQGSSDSSIKKIVVKSEGITCNKCKNEKFLHQFDFDESNNLIRIVTDTLR